MRSWWGVTVAVMGQLRESTADVGCPGLLLGAFVPPLVSCVCMCCSTGMGLWKGSGCFEVWLPY